MSITAISDLRHKIGPVRDQGERPTCLAFAASDTHSAMREKWKALSCEYIYYHSIKRDGSHPDNGATLPAILQALRLDGQPPEEEWEYLSAVPEDTNNWSPPSSVTPLYKRDSIHRHASIEQIKRCLDADTPIIVTMCLSNAFYMPSKDGVVNSNEAPDPAIRHAVIAVGYGENGEEKFILVRNSWGRSWGELGYAWVSEDYLYPRLIDIVELTKDLSNVSSNKAA